MQSTAIRIGTRGSPLALAQARETRRRLAAALAIPEEEIAIVAIRTSGDRIQDRPLAEVGGKGLFTREIDDAMLAGEIDIAVHSAKDLPTALPDGISLVASLPREDTRDALLSAKATRIEDLPEGAVLGTSSLRRRAMALRLRPDLKVVDFRGNVETRIRKLEEGVADATILAMAGLNRLGLAHRAAGAIDAPGWLPAVAQGTIAVTARTGDDASRERLALVDDAATSVTLAAERAFLALLDGSCRTPIGGLATLGTDGILSFRGVIVRPDGSEAHEAGRTGPAAEAAALGAAVGEELHRRGGPGFFAA